MTNKPMLSVERELIQRIADHCKFWVDHPYLEAIADVEVELRALLDADKVNNREMGLMQYVEAHPIKPAAQHQGEPVAWSYCPECGCEELHHECGEHKQCKNCHQEWFSDIDYSEVVRGNLQKLKAEQNAAIGLTVWFGSMPESNGKSNWTAILHRKADSEFPLRALSGGITIDRSEYHDRVRYEADRMRYLIGELTEEPDILAYDEKMHSGYVKPEQPAPVAVVMPERMDINEFGLTHSGKLKYEGYNKALDDLARLNGVKP